MEFPMIMGPTEVQDGAINTLRFTPGRCINCGRCIEVCPQGVFAPRAARVSMVAAPECMECGACQMNCPAGAVSVDAGVGCAAAMIRAALTGKKEVTCGPECCGR